MVLTSLFPLANFDLNLQKVAISIVFINLEVLALTNVW